MTETQTSGPPSTRGASARPRGCGRYVIGALVIVCAVFVFLPILLSSAYIAGEEFCPDVFQRRTFAFLELPYFRIQIRPITREDTTTPLEQFLINNKHITKVNTKSPRWDLVHQHGLNPLAPECDARLLCRYLDQYDANGDQTWLDWSNDNPELSKVLWPAIARLARAEHYIFVPDLFQLATNATDAVSLQREINDVLNQKYRQRAMVDQQLEDHDMAVKHFTAALSYNPQDVESLRGRATSHEALGEPTDARSDRDEADRMASSGSPSE